MLKKSSMALIKRIQFFVWRIGNEYCTWMKHPKGRINSGKPEPILSTHTQTHRHWVGFSMGFVFLWSNFVQPDANTCKKPSDSMVLHCFELWCLWRFLQSFLWVFLTKKQLAVFLLVDWSFIDLEKSPYPVLLAEKPSGTIEVLLMDRVAALRSCSEYTITSTKVFWHPPSIPASHCEVKKGIDTPPIFQLLALRGFPYQGKTWQNHIKTMGKEDNVYCIIYINAYTHTVNT